MTFHEHGGRRPCHGSRLGREPLGHKTKVDVWGFHISFGDTRASNLPYCEIGPSFRLILQNNTLRVQPEASNVTTAEASETPSEICPKWFPLRPNTNVTLIGTHSLHVSCIPISFAACGLLS